MIATVPSPTAMITANVPIAHSMGRPLGWVGERRLVEVTARFRGTGQ